MSEAWDLAKKGMKQASDHVGRVDPGWKDLAREAIHATAKRCRWPIIDDVHDQLRAMGVGVPSISHGCALGHLMTEAKENGYLESTVMQRRSGRPESHADLRPVWKSLIYDPKAPVIPLVEGRPRLCRKCGGNRFVKEGICMVCVRQEEAEKGNSNGF